MLLLITADQPEAGQRLYLFSYLFPVLKSGQRALACWGLEMLLGCPCAAVLYHNHWKTPERPSGRYTRAFSSPMGVPLAARGHQPGGAHWGKLLGLPRIMWVGFSCSSILTACRVPPR